jgi:hypothetical protein
MDLTSHITQWKLRISTEHFITREKVSKSTLTNQSINRLSHGCNGPHSRECVPGVSSQRSTCPCASSKLSPPGNLVLSHSTTLQSVVGSQIIVVQRGQGSHSAALTAAESVCGDQEMLAAARASRASRKPFNSSWINSKPHPVSKILHDFLQMSNWPPARASSSCLHSLRLARAATPVTGVTLSVCVSGDFPDSFLRRQERL